MKMRNLSVMIVAGVVLAACANDDDNDKSGDCGDPISGVSCERDDGTCTAQICVDGNWECPSGSSEVALTADSCQGGEGGSGGAGNDCGEPLDGVTCERDNGTCTEQICVDGNWECPDDTSEIAVTADSCQGGEGGSGGAAS